MQNIKVIIGASYGDEGKGLAADFFGAEAGKKHGTINVLTNGGPQRGHTVELEDGTRHVFKHLGAAAFRGAATYMAEQFLVNPMAFCREYNELCVMGHVPETYMDPRCRFTTPWDMLVNQILQERRGLHNSCGFGIWETVLRYDRGYGIPVGRFLNMSREDRLSFLIRLRDSYFVKRVRELGLVESEGENVPRFLSSGSLPGGLEDLFFSESLLRRFEEDCETMRFLCPMRDEDYLRHFETVLFENAQGLLLDGNAPEEQDFTTPSTTGAGRVFQTIERVFQGADAEIVYVNRSYLTRHGDGIMENELDAAQRRLLLPGVRPDATNGENRFQGILRYGMMDVNSLADRISADYALCCGAVRNRYRSSVMITHMNEFAGIDTGLLAERFDTLYLSDGKTRSAVFKAAGAV